MSAKNLIAENSARGAVEKVRLHPQTPQGGLSKSLDFNKSPLGDLGVARRKLTFSTPSLTTDFPDRFKYIIFVIQTFNNR
jgi:hypothetical protein